MKKILRLMSLIFVAVIFIFTVNIVNAEDFYDSSNLTVTNGGLITYEDVSLVDGWYTLEIDGTVTNPVGLTNIVYYTDDLSSGYTVGTTNYTRNEDYSVSTSLTMDIYVINGNWKLQFNNTDTLNTSTVAASITLSLIEINELNPDNLSVTSNSLIYNSSLLDGWYQLDIYSISDTPTGLASDPQYYTADPFVGETLGAGFNTVNYDVTTSNEMHVEIYIADGDFKIESANTFDVALSDVTHINLTLIELDYQPEFNYTELTLSAPNYDIPSISELKNMLTATDGNDGDLTSSITLYDENLTSYSSGDTLPYDYYVTYSVEDSSGNTAYLTVDVTVFDAIDPVIYVDGSAQSTYIYHQSVEDDLTAMVSFMNNITATDETDGNITSNIVIGSIPTIDGVGDYHMTIDVVDSAGNSASLDWIIRVEDITAPSFDGSPDYIYASSNTEITLSEIETNYLTYSDNVDEPGDITISVVYNDYTANKDTAGRYQIIYSATDLIGNLSYHTIVVFVVDQSPPLYVVDDQFVQVSLNQPITEGDLTDILTAYGIVVTELGFSFEVVDGDYFDDPETLGIHTLSLRITYDDDSTEDISLVLNVVDDNSSIINWFDSLNTAQKILSIGGSMALFGLIGLAIFRPKHRG